MVTLPDFTVADFASAARYGASARQGPHHCAQTLITSGPRRSASRTSGPLPRHGRLRSGRPLVTGGFDGADGQALSRSAPGTVLRPDDGVPLSPARSDPHAPSVTDSTNATAPTRSGRWLRDDVPDLTPAPSPASRRPRS